MSKKQTYKVEASYVEDGKHKTESVTFHGMDSREEAEAHLRHYAKSEGWKSLKIKHITLQ
jgi:hypothetical protein